VTLQSPIKLLAAEKTLIAQLNQAGAKKAAEKLAKTGLPTRRVEAYHYTDLKSLIKAVPELAGGAGDAGGTEPSGAPGLHLPAAFSLVTRNGRVPKNATPPAGLVVSSQEGSPLSERDDVLVMLNRALVGQRLKLELKGQLERVIVVDHRTGGRASHVSGALELELAAGAGATVVEVFSGSDGAHLGNHATRVRLGEGARLNHIVVDLSSLAASHFHNIQYDVGAGAYLYTLAVNSGSKLSRTQLFARFDGEGGRGDFTGLNLVDDGQHCDVTLDVIHAVPNTASTQTYKTVARNRARAVFQGRIVVEQNAQMTDARMMAQGLMLSEGAQILCKPELEIFADEVQCAHGATCGELDAEQMFYLMSRGIGRVDAAAILTRAFICELLDRVKNKQLYEALRAIIENWLANTRDNQRS